MTEKLNITIFIAIRWFYEGDSYPVGEYIDVYTSKEKLKSEVKLNYEVPNIINDKEYIQDKHNKDIYVHIASRFKRYKEVKFIYDENEFGGGNYGDASMVQIIEKKL